MQRTRVLAVLLSLAGVLPLFSQTSSTAILGTVVDASGAVVANARVTLLQVQTGIKREDITSSTGDYNFPLLDPGEYSVTVQAPGFRTQTRTGIRLELDLKARIDFHLEVGSEVQTVDVTAEAALLNTDQATLGQVVTTRRVEELPLNGRNIGSLAVLQPGVQFGGRMGLLNVNGNAGGVPVPGVTISISANGQRDTDQHATLDGVAVTEARVNTVPFTPSPEAIEEFKVQAGTYSAEYGTHAGAQLVIALKSGTNAFHGSAFEFLRNDKLDAEDYFQNYFIRPVRHRLQRTGCVKTSTAACSAARSSSPSSTTARTGRFSCSTTRRTRSASRTRWTGQRSHGGVPQRRFECPIEPAR